MNQELDTGDSELAPKARWLALMELQTPTRSGRVCRIHADPATLQRGLHVPARS